MDREVPRIAEIIAQVRADPRMDGAIGEPLDREPCDELAHFYLCKACHQPVDRRDLAAVFHHEDRGHSPLPAEDAERLLRIGEQLRAALEQPPPPAG